MCGDEQDVLIRRLRYRLQRQGMLELDAWLAPLQLALQTKDDAVVQAINRLTQHEAPDLLAMQAGDIDIPMELAPWLKA